MDEPETRVATTDAGNRRDYFRTNLRLIAVLLSIWAFVSFGCGILLAPWLNGFKLPFTEYPLGFWFAQQGSIFGFVAIIFTYIYLMNRLDNKLDKDK